MRSASELGDELSRSLLPWTLYRRILLLLCAMDGLYIATKSQKKAKQLLNPFRQTQVLKDVLFGDEMVLLRHGRSAELNITKQ